MHKKFKIAGLLAVLLSVWMEAGAAGLGRLTVQSALGQPLKAEIELYSVGRDELPSVNAKLANIDAFRQARIERLDTLNGLRFSVEQRPNGQPIVRITSSAPVNDPFLDLLIELNWASGRLLREYTLLLDPPVEAKPAAPVERPTPPVTSAPVESKPAAVQKPAEPAKPVVKDEAKAEKPALKEYGPVEKGQTLRGIASKLKPSDATTEQMMVGLYQANKSAFIDGNMNRLRKGEVLKVPDFESLMLAASPSQARQMVHEQAAEWRATHGKSGETVAAPAKDKAAAGKVEPAKPETQLSAAAPAKDVLKLSKGEPVAVGKADAKTADRLHAMEEDLAAKSRALKEAQDRVAQLEKTVQDLQRLVEMRTQQAATAPAPEAKPATPAAPVEAAKPPAPVPQASLIDELLANPLYLGGGLAGVLLLALLGVSAARRRRQKAEPEGILAGVNSGLFGDDAPAPVAADVAVASQQDSGVLTDFSRLGLGAIDTQEIDPIAEAEVYLAYGKEVQAEEILRDALSKHPDREDVLSKLLEIYHARKDIATFETTARALQTAVGGDAEHASWLKAAAMGREIDPENLLYAEAGVVAPEPIEPASPVSLLDMEIPAMESLEMPVEPEPSPEPASPRSALPAGLDFEFSMDMPEATEAPAASEPEPALEDAMGLDFTPEPAMAMPAEETAPIEIEQAAEVESEPEPEPESEEEAVPEEEIAGLEAMPSFDEIEEAATPAPEPTPSKLPDLDFGGLDLDLSEPAPEAAEAAPAAAAEAVVEEQALPDLDIGALDLGVEEIEATAASEAATPEGELPDLDLNLNEAEASASAAAEPDISIAAPVDVSEEALAEVNTKIDLARAYLEMGDKEGAREILQEVLAEGSSQQIEAANKLLAEAD